jgi:metallophosphoesterase (TIGR00282 family)
MRLLFVGDLVGRPGRRILTAELSGLIDRHLVDYVVVNLENVAGGFGVTRDIYEELSELPVDCFTSGNHIWDKKDVIALLDEHEELLRPANYPGGNPGVGVHVGETAAGIRVATINLEGRVFMKDLESPFVVADRLLEDLDTEIKVVFVDFHAETTSEKQALGIYLDGRVSALVGTHTHVPTADERILPGGTAFLTDAGMTGPYESVIGMRADRVIERFLKATPTPFQVAKGDVRLAGALIDIDPDSGRAERIERVMVRESEA